MMVNPLHEHFDPEHLAGVIEEMRQLGAPRLRGFYDAAVDVWHAKEGTHRLRAAKALGLMPVLLPVPWGRSAAALVRARFLAAKNAHTFDCGQTPPADTAGPAHGIDTDGVTVWVNTGDGCLGRFGRNGIDIHRPHHEQAEHGECLHCTHAETTREDWFVFVAKMYEHHGVTVDASYMPERFT